MMLPKRPVMSDKDVAAAAEDFLKGKVPDRAAAPRKKDKVKMYNLPIPVELHAQAKANASLMCMTLAEYFLKALDEANKKYSLK